MTDLVQLPQISYASPNFSDAFMASLHRYGFAAVVDHPLDDGGSNASTRIGWVSLPIKTPRISRWIR